VSREWKEIEETGSIRVEEGKRKNSNLQGILSFYTQVFCKKHVKNTHFTLPHLPILATLQKKTSLRAKR
jgi:hypothetical protein